jgi:hypothetical protein
MQTQKLIQTSRMTAVISFVLGTVILLIHQVLPNYVEVIMLGLIYIGIATFINLIFVIALFIEMILRPILAEELMISLGIMLLNIPIAIGYVFIVLPIY